jgi:type IV pilus assembly protein PilM
MLKFVNNLFAAKSNPIGVDFGTDAIRLAQVQWTGSEFALTAAATADVPSHIRNDPAGRAAFFVESIRDLMAQGGFKGRQVVLALPAAALQMRHIRVPKMDEASLKKSIPFEARGQFTFDASGAVVRHMVAGELSADTESKLEVIVMAAARSAVNDYLAAAAKAKLDVVGMNVEPRVVVDCFAQLYRRKTDADTINAFIDIGSAGTRVIISRGRQIYFARTISIGGNTFTAAVASALKLNFEDAKLLRMRLASVSPASAEPIDVTPPIIRPLAAASPAPAEESFALLNAGLASAQAQTSSRMPDNAPVASMSVANPIAREDTSASADLSRQERNEARSVDQACRDMLNKLVDEIELCRRYFEGTFPNKPVERLIFVGGEARQRSLCQHIAREMGLAAQVGDPLVRMGRISDISMESGIDRRHPQPAWAVAIGLSMGAVAQVGVEA